MAELVELLIREQADRNSVEWVLMVMRRTRKELGL